MNTTQKLIKRRNTLKKYIDNNIINTPMGLLLSFPTFLVKKLTGRYVCLPIKLSIFLLGFLVSLPTLLALFIFDEFDTLTKLEWVGVFVVLEGFCISVSMAYFNVNKLLRKLQTHVIDSLMSISDLDDLQKWFSLGWTPDLFRGYLLYWVVLLIPIAIVNMFLVFGERQSISLYVWVITFLILSGISWSYAPLNMLLPIRLSRYSYALHEIAPAHSEVVGRISSSLNYYAYGYAINAAIVQLIFALVSRFYLFGISAAFIAWIPLILQFMLNQYGMRRIVMNAKRKTLQNIQSQIKELHNESIRNKKNVDTILRLMDYHDRVRLTPNSVLDMRAVINLSNQLAIPTLGFLFANYEKILLLFP